MENIELNGKSVNLNSLSMEKLKSVFKELDTQELLMKQEINSILEELT